MMRRVRLFNVFVSFFSFAVLSYLFLLYFGE